MPWRNEAKEGSSGLAEKYNATIRRARWGFPFPKAGDQIALILDFEREIDGSVDDGHIWLKPGNGWELGDKDGTINVQLGDGGAVDTRPVGTFIEFYADGELKADKVMNKNSGYHRFLKSALDAGVPLEAVQDPARMQYEEKDALMWEGLKLEITEKEESGTIQRGEGAGQTWNRRQPLVTAFLGTVEGGAAPTASASTNGNAGGDKREAAAALAKSSDTFIKYLDAANKELGIDPSDELASNDFYVGARA